MKQEIDPQGHHRWVLSPEEIQLGFLTQCVERAAAEAGCDYLEMLSRLERAGLTEGYILRHYEALHSQSIEYVVTDLLEALQQRESLL